MGALAITVIVGAGLLIGFGVQYFTNPRSQLDWLFVALATGIGAYLGSLVLSNSTLGILAGGPEIDGLVIIPAVITGVALGLLADAYVRYLALPEPA
jgi:hypothetical protein